MENFTTFFICVILLTILYIYFENKYTEVNYMVSTIDKRKYLVQNHSDKLQAANNLAIIRKNLVKLVQEMKKNNKGNVDVERMVNNFNPNNISESDENNKYTSYSVNKGEKIVFCLRSRDERNKLVDINIMMFVALHELAHTMTKSIGHTTEFWNNFRILLRNAQKLGIYKRIDYDKNPVDYCGTKITNDPENYA
jgi:predicted metal-dependent hydrolase